MSATFSSENLFAVAWNAAYRTATLDYDSDRSSIISESDTDDEAQPSTLAAHIIENQAELSRVRGAWNIRSYEANSSYAVVDPPSASKMNYKVMHPLHYRHGRIATGIPVATDFAPLANVLRAPADWRDQLASVEASDNIYNAMTAFADWQGLEQPAEGLFDRLVFLIATHLNRTVKLQGHLPFAVGGLLVDLSLIITGYTDNFWTTTPTGDLATNANQVDGEAAPPVILISEMRTLATWRPQAKWYRSNRGLQSRAALYASRAPTLLICPAQFKLFLPPMPDHPNGLTYPPENGVSPPQDLIPVLTLIFLTYATITPPTIRRSRPVAVLTPQRKSAQHDPSTEERLSNPSTRAERYITRLAAVKGPLDHEEGVLSSDEENDEPLYGSSLVWVANSCALPKRD